MILKTVPVILTAVDKEKRMRPRVHPLYLCSSVVILLSSNRTTLLLDTSSLTSELAQIVKLSATYLTNLVHLDRVDVRRLDGEDTLHTNGTRHLANSETLLVTMAANLDNDTTVELNALL